MSETVRTYTGNRYAGYTKSRRRRGARKRLFRGLAILALAVLVWAWWTTRDVYSLGALIPNNQAYYLCAPDFLQRRASIAASTAWDAVPEDSPLRKVRGALSNRFGQAEWLVNNVFQGPVYLSGQDLEQFGDVLFATRMSRIGALTEKVYSFFPSVKSERIEGTRLRRLEYAGFYYAVRGRILAISRSATALAHALSLPPGQALGEEALAGIAARDGEGDIVCAVHPSGTNALGTVVDDARITMQWLPRAFRIRVEGTPRPEWRDRLAPLLDGVHPQPLQAPLDGLVSVSGNLEKTLPELWQAAASVWGESFPLASLPDYLAIPFRKTEEWNAFAENLAGHLGPAFRVTLGAIDQNAMLPTPEFAALLEVAEDDPPAWPPEVPASSESLAPEDPTPRYDAEHQRLTIPTVDGPSLQPTLAPYGGGLLASTSSALADSILATTPNEEMLPQPANLFVRIQPHPTLEAFYAAALQFVQLGVVRNYDPASFEALVSPWLQQTGQIHSILASVSHEEGSIRLDMELAMNP